MILYQQDLSCDWNQKQTKFLKRHMTENSRATSLPRKNKSYHSYTSINPNQDSWATNNRNRYHPKLYEAPTKPNLSQTIVNLKRKNCCWCRGLGNGKYWSTHPHWEHINDLHGLLIDQVRLGARRWSCFANSKRSTTGIPSTPLKKRKNQPTNSGNLLCASDGQLGSRAELPSLPETQNGVQNLHVNSEENFSLLHARVELELIGSVLMRSESRSTRRYSQGRVLPKSLFCC